MFKVVLSRVFDLRCNLEEISGAGEPLLLFSKGEGEAAAASGGKPKKASGAGEGGSGAAKGSAK